ncbi:MAG: hydroxymethylbilane synthase, partial [Caldilinea sp.]
MTEHIATLRLGTRGSTLARWQTDYIAARLSAAWPGLAVEVEILHTQGDRILDKPLPLIGGKGLFTAELETALHSGAIDLAVHSLKDLPTELQPGIVIGAIPTRADVHDVVV